MLQRSQAALALAGCTAVGPELSVARARGAVASAVRQRALANLYPGPAAGPLVEPVRRPAARPTGRRGAGARTRTFASRRPTSPAPGPLLRETRAGRLPVHRPQRGHTAMRRTPAAIPPAAAMTRAWTSATRSTCSAASAARSRRAARMSVRSRPRSTTRGSASLPKPSRAYADACSAGQQLAVARESLRRPGADVRPDAPPVRRRARHGARYRAGGRAARAGAGDAADAGGAAPGRAVPAGGPDRPPAGQLPARKSPPASARRSFPGPSRSATAPRFCRAGRTSARPSASWPRPRPGSGWPRPTSTRK